MLVDHVDAARHRFGRTAEVHRRESARDHTMVMEVVRHVKRGWGAVALAAGFLVAVGSVPAGAQRDSARVQGESRFEHEVESLARQLMQKRVTVINLTRALTELRLTLRSAGVPDSLRPRFERSIRQMQIRLESTEGERSRLLKRLGTLCGADRHPEGWMGMAFSGEVRVWRDVGGPNVYRFLEYPTVESVDPNSPAEKAGLQGGDRIISFGGRDIRERDIVFTTMLKPGVKLLLTVRRGAESRPVMINVERRPDGYETPCPWIDESIAAAFAPVMPSQFSFVTPRAPQPPGAPSAPVVVGAVPSAPSPNVATVPSPAALAPLPGVPPTPAPFSGFTSSTSFVIAGAQVTQLNADLADALGAERGVLVLNVFRGLPADQSGLKGGDVILSADGRELNTPEGFIRAIEQSSGREVRLQIVRKKKVQTLALRW